MPSKPLILNSGVAHVLICKLLEGASEQGLGIEIKNKDITTIYTSNSSDGRSRKTERPRLLDSMRGGATADGG